MNILLFTMHNLLSSILTRPFVDERVCGMIGLDDRRKDDLYKLLMKRDRDVHLILILLSVNHLQEQILARLFDG